MEIEIHIDGRCEPNPNGVATFGILVQKNNPRGVLEGISGYVGSGKGMTNNLAEYTALTKALEWLRDNDCWNDEILVKTDSQLIANQMTGKAKARRGGYLGEYKKAMVLIEGFPHLDFLWIPDTDNTIAHSLAEEAYLDLQKREQRERIE